MPESTAIIRFDLPRKRVCGGHRSPNSTLRDPRESGASTPPREWTPTVYRATLLGSARKGPPGSGSGPERPSFSASENGWCASRRLYIPAPLNRNGTRTRVALRTRHAPRFGPFSFAGRARSLTYRWPRDVGRRGLLTPSGTGDMQYLLLHFLHRGVGRVRDALNKDRARCRRL